MDHMTDTSTAKSGPAPAGNPSLMTYFAVNDCAKAIDFYQDVFGAELLTRFDGADGIVAHAEMRLGDAVFQLGDPMPDYGLIGPPAEGNGFTITYWTADVDTIYARAVAAGATVMTPLDDAFSGDRMGVIRCPFGIRWCIARHDRDVSPEEIQAAAEEWMRSQPD